MSAAEILGCIVLALIFGVLIVAVAVGVVEERARRRESRAMRQTYIAPHG